MRERTPDFSHLSHCNLNDNIIFIDSFKYLKNFTCMERRKRLLREYLLKREDDNKQEKRREEIKEAYKNNVKLTHDLKEDAQHLLTEIIYDIPIENEQKTPKILVTTSRNPSSMLRESAKRISNVFSGKLLSRGSLTVEELSEHCVTDGITTLIILTESKGKPSTMTISFFPTGPTFCFNITKFRLERSVSNHSTNVGLIVDNFNSEIGLKLANFTKLMFPKREIYKRIILVANRNDVVIVHHFNDIEKFTSDLSFEMKLYEIKKCTFDMDSQEWSIRAFLNSSNKNLL